MAKSLWMHGMFRQGMRAQSSDAVGAFEVTVNEDGGYGEAL